MQYPSIFWKHPGKRVVLSWDSVRTIKRAIDFMKTRLNLPMEFDGKKNGFYFTKSVPQFPQMPMSEADVFTMFVAGKAIEQYRGTPLQRMLEATFRKVTGQLDQSVRVSLGSMDGVLSFRPFAPGDAELKDFNLLMRAVGEKRTVKFMYRNRGQVKAQQRHVRPYHFACVDNQWCLFGFDVDRKAMRTFVLARLSRLELTRRKFTRRRGFNPDDICGGVFRCSRGRRITRWWWSSTIGRRICCGGGGGTPARRDPCPRISRNRFLFHRAPTAPKGVQGSMGQGVKK